MPACTPVTQGVLPTDRAYISAYTFNDLESVREAVEAAGDDFAGECVSGV